MRDCLGRLQAAGEQRKKKNSEGRRRGKLGQNPFCRYAGFERRPTGSIADIKPIPAAALEASFPGEELTIAAVSCARLSPSAWATTASRPEPFSGPSSRLTAIFTKYWYGISQRKWRCCPRCSKICSRKMDRPESATNIPDAGSSVSLAR
jgi:hypothetical protein